MASELEDLREAFHKLANRDFTDLVVSERAKGAADMRKRIAAVICPFCNKGVPISKGGRHLGIECFAIEVWTLPLDGGDGDA